MISFKPMAKSEESEYRVRSVGTFASKEEQQSKRAVLVNFEVATLND